VDVWFRVERDATGRVVRLIGVNQDVTERRRAEEDRERLQAQLLQAQKMESVGRLAGGVAHDFNNMLQAMLGNVELALEDAGEDGHLRDHLIEVQRVAHRSADLTRQLLAFARRQTVNPRVVDFNATVAGTLKMLRRLIGEDIDLSWEPALAVWPVRVDPSQVDQILANLVVNARDAIAGVGRITLSTANATLDEAYCASRPWARPGEYVRLAVADTGGGMGPDVLAHLFEPFFTTKDLGKGTGLGLATVYGIVKQNDGIIDVASEIARGTTISVYLPRCADPVPTVSAGASATVRGGHETVLVVEDEHSILSLLRTVLSRQGYHVLTVRTPNDALERARTHAGAVDLLITDVVMPQMNGRELAERLRARWPRLKALFMSGYSVDIIAHGGAVDQGVQFIAKPFSASALADKVRETLER
jgi:signal transduction histidine kinase